MLTPPEGSATAAEWLFKKGGRLYGPVPQERLLELLAAGELGPAPEVSPGGGAFAAPGSFPALRPHLERLRQRALAAAEQARARRRAARRRALRWVAYLSAGLAVLAVGVAVAWVLAVKRPWVKRSELLAGLAAVTVGEATVASRSGLAAGRGREAEIEVPEATRQGPHEGGPRRAPTPRPGRAGAPAAPGGPRPEAAGGGGLVLSRYDPVRIQRVVADRRGGLTRCVRAEVARNPDLSGQLPIEFAIGNDGRPVQLWIDEPRLRTGPLRDCLWAELRGWSFEAFAGERPVVSLAFEVGAR